LPLLLPLLLLPPTDQPPARAADGGSINHARKTPKKTTCKPPA
jgi:hypothetical protein